MLGMGPMNYQATPKVKKAKAHARGATLPGPSTPASIPAPSTPGSASTGFGGYVNPMVPQLPSTPSLQTTGSVDSNSQTVSTGAKKSGGFFGLFKKDSRSGSAKSNEDLPIRGQALYGRSEEVTVNSVAYEQVDSMEEINDFPQMGILPPPDFIRPTPGQRLIPRREPNALYRAPAIPLGTTQIGRARARAAARLNESISEISESDWQTTTDGDEERSSWDLSSFYDQGYQHLSDVVDSAEQHRLIVLASAPAGDDAAMTEWSKYIRSYSVGSFKISNPPSPPRRHVGFAYLPAVYPRDEEARLQKHHSIDGPWSNELAGKILALMGAAAKQFRTKNASLSVFDERFEKLRADCGYFIDANIKRTTSMAAHVLYSEEVLVVLDTHQDWRFAGNPWVIGAPQIRFFAGAPLISDDGEIIAVFSIFSKKPRSEFSRGNRRELAEFAALMAKDICLWAEHISDPDLRRSVIASKRDTGANLVPNPLNLEKQQSPVVSQSEFFPTGLKFHQQSSPLANRSNFSNADVFVSNPETSISYESSIGDSEILYMAVPGRHRISNDNSPEAFHQYLGPSNTQTFQERPFSTSDLTSVDMPQYNTPNDSYISGESSNYELSGPATPRQPQFDFQHPIYRNIGPSASGVSLNNSFGRLYMEADSTMTSTYDDELLRPAAANTSMSLTRRLSTKSSTSVLTTLSSRIGGPNNGDEVPTYTPPPSRFAEANFSCSFTGTKHSFDQVYAVQVDCPYPGMSDQELLGPNGLSLKILASYGLPYGYESELNRNVYLKEVFLKGLRTDDYYYIWTPEDGPELREEGALGFGVLMPLHRDDGLGRSRDHGIVYALFNKARFDANDNLQSPIADLYGLRCAARSMKMLLLNCEMKEVDDQSITKSRAPRESTPTIIGATEMGRIYYSRRSTSGHSRNSSF
ncbi:hypothetical protein DSL72_002291 [Monilinia vaccinii-corymbosi]|uniref:GAF domain-containing protein n=1 Tax=Monilinia vaccinii-corymbosi TaxID=61207 RepID=A0A8A3PC62_9HELO|nr:hypothetical protein DSL72_002291 [Monilinia vaccinii-corymbosi]